MTASLFKVISAFQIIINGYHLKMGKSISTNYFLDTVSYNII